MFSVSAAVYIPQKPQPVEKILRKVYHYIIVVLVKSVTVLQPTWFSNPNPSNKFCDRFAELQNDIRISEHKCC